MGAFGGSKKLTVPLIRFLEDFRLLSYFPKICMTGLGIPLENILTQLPKTTIHGHSLTHLTITNAAFVKYVSCPNSSCEVYFDFDVSALANAGGLQCFHIHFDKIVQAVHQSYIQGAWLSGMEHCHAQAVRIQVESPPLASVLGGSPSFGSDTRMVFRVRIPSRVHHLYILTDCVVQLSRPAGTKYDTSPYSGQDIWEGDVDPAGIFNLCLLSVNRPSCEIANTQIRRVHPNMSAILQRPLVLTTSNSTPDQIYAENLRKLAPGHCDLEAAAVIPCESWDDE